MSIFYFVPLCITSLFLILILKKQSPEYSYFISLVVGIIILFFSAKELAPILETIKSFFQRTNLPVGYIEVLLKSLGICYVTELGASLCADAGERAISLKLELAGKLAILTISLPLFNDILSYAIDLIRF